MEILIPKIPIYRDRMDNTEGKNGDDVNVTVELTGTYDDVVSKLSIDGTGQRRATELLADLEAVLETIDRIDGGTRSAVAENLPAEMTVAYDPEELVDVLHVLERYDLVRLEGNTWYPATESA